MIPVMQTELDRKGNCYSACVASILEIPIESLPNLHQWGRNWLIPFSKAVHEHGYNLLIVRPSMITRMPYIEGTYCILTGKSPRGRCNHAVVALGSCQDDGRFKIRMVHDPHPDNAGVLKPFVDITFFVKVV